MDPSGAHMTGGIGRGGGEEEEAVIFELDTGASSQQMDVAFSLAVVALAKAGRMGGASKLGNSL